MKQLIKTYGVEGSYLLETLIPLKVNVDFLQIHGKI